jgi:hypothetical protein
MQAIASSLHPQSEFHTNLFSHLVFVRSVHRLLVTANVVASSPILVTLMMEALSSSETWGGWSGPRGGGQVGGRVAV